MSMIYKDGRGFLTSVGASDQDCGVCHVKVGFWDSLKTILLKMLMLIDLEV